MTTQGECVFILPPYLSNAEILGAVEAPTYVNLVVVDEEDET